MSAPTIEHAAPGNRAAGGLFLECEITRNCNEFCDHCYADSGPRGDHGTMTTSDWLRVIDQAGECAIRDIQLIGGEPTQHPDFARIMAYALDAGLGVEVYSNLMNVTPQWWSLYEHPRAYLATSYYSDRADEHDTITRRFGSHAKTRANIAEAVRRGIHIRAGIVDVRDGQRVVEARADLHALGVTNINTDRTRNVGRGRRGNIPSVGELCGRCGRDNLAISPDGDVWGCTISRFLPSVGNVRTHSLATILESPAMRSLIETIPPRTAACQPGGDSAPSVCGPQVCGPSGQGS